MAVHADLHMVCKMQAEIDTVKIFLDDKTLDRLIDFVVCIGDPLLSLVRRAEDKQLSSGNNEISCPIYSDELRRLADIQEAVNKKSDPDIKTLGILQFLSQK